MKILLVAINSKYIHSNPAVYSLKEYAGGEDITVREYTINQNRDDVLADIYAAGADVVAVSCYIWNIGFVCSLLWDLHAISPETRIWLGGPEAGYNPAATFEKLPFAELIIRGEGEETFRELADGQTEIRKIRGLNFPDGGSTGDRELLDLGHLPFLYDDISKFDGRILYYESSRGCPYRCAYCLSSTDTCVRMKSLEQVKRELSVIIRQKPKLLKFTDRTFNCSRRQTEEIWRFLKDTDNGVTRFHFEIAAELLTEEQIELIGTMRPGLIQLEIGVQSTNEKTLKAIDRPCDLKKLKDVVARIHEKGNIHQHLDLIAGLPYEDYESFRRSFDEVYAMKPDQLQLGFLKVLAGSPMYDRAGEHGIVYEREAPYEVLKTAYLSYPEVRFLKRISEMVELYYNSMQFKELLKRIEFCFSSPFEMYASMARMYERKEYTTRPPARSRKYEVFLEWAGEEECIDLPQELLREAALTDMYLRENLKSRPEWAGERGFEQQIRDFYDREARTGEVLKEAGTYTSAQLSRMTHIEVLKEGRSEPLFLLFDYARRHPLTQDAAVTHLSLDDDGVLRPENTHKE